MKQNKFMVWPGMSSFQKVGGLSCLVLIVTIWATMISRAGAQQTRVIQTPAPYNACNVRNGPGVGYTTIGTFFDGTVVTLSGPQSGGWYAVEIGNIVGWMARQCF